MTRNIPFKRVRPESERMIRAQHARAKLICGRFGYFVHEDLRADFAQEHPPQKLGPVIKKTPRPEISGRSGCFRGYL
jgi:hypothetical protein